MSAIAKLITREGQQILSDWGDYQTIRARLERDVEEFASHIRETIMQEADRHFASFLAARTAWVDAGSPVTKVDPFSNDEVTGSHPTEIARDKAWRDLIETFEERKAFEQEVKEFAA